MRDEDHDEANDYYRMTNTDYNMTSRTCYNPAWFPSKAKENNAGCPAPLICESLEN